MAETRPAANNKPIAFGDEVGREPAGVRNAAPVKKPSKHARKAAKGAVKRGMISEKAAKKHLGGY